MLILNEQDLRELVSWPQMIDFVEEAYRIFARGESLTPDRLTVTRGRDTITFMPCFTNEIFGTKFLTLFLDNPAKGYPYLDGLMFLNDLDNGKTLSIMDARYLTALRTGAVGGVGVRHLSRPDCKTAGVIGAGQQGFTQAIYAANARNLERLYLYDAFDKDWPEFIARLHKEIDQPDLDILVCKSGEELVKKSEIVITATPAEVPVLPDDPELLRGKCIIAIGSYKHEMREIPDSIWQLLDEVYIELPFALEETGDLYYPLQEGLFTEDQIRYIGDLLEAGTEVYPQPGETSFFKSVGMGILDLHVARKLYELAVEHGIGQKVKF